MLPILFWQRMPSSGCVKSAASLSAPWRKGVDAAAREQNKQTMQAVYAIKAQRIMSITNGIAGLKDKSRIKMRLVDWLDPR